MTISETTTVRDLLTRHPETFDVFLRHGMCEDCKAAPPPVPAAAGATYRRWSLRRRIRKIVARLKGQGPHPPVRSENPRGSFE